MRRLAFGIVLSLSLAAAAPAQESAIERMNAPGPEAERLAERAGTWDLTLTMRPSPDAEPIVWTDLIAERRMTGLFLEEIIRPAPGSDQPDFERISYLTYNRIEGRWQYVSLDTRFPAGIMPAYSVDRQSPEHIVLEFESLAFPGGARRSTAGCCARAMSSRSTTRITRRRSNSGRVRTARASAGSAWNTSTCAGNSPDFSYRPWLGAS